MLRVTWLGHSTTVIELDGVMLLTDPVLRRRVGHLRRREAADHPGIDRLDAVLVSHVHLDHLDHASLRRVDKSRRLVVPAGSGPILRRRGFTQIDEVVRGDRVAIGDVEIEVTDADHHVKRIPLGRQTPAVGYVVRGSQSVYFAGDTDLFQGMAEHAGNDLALLPISGWGPRLPAGHLNPESAARALTLLRPRVVVPIHWGTYSPIHMPHATDAPAHEFTAHAAELAPEVDVRVLPVGGSIELPAAP